MQNILISVCMITYNHEKLIAQAIESVMAQKTNFIYELVVGEDHSTDNTRDTLLTYKEKYPNIIKLIFWDRNIGMMQNFIDALGKCNGRYIALLEGDDYWTDPYKLQKQIDLLEANLDYAICFHNTKVIYEGTNKEHLSNAPNQKKVTTIHDIIKDWYIMTPSMVFRKDMLGELPEWFLKVHNGDYALHLLLANKGKISYLEEVMAVYRKHDSGSSNLFSSKRYYFKSLYFLFTKFNEHTEYKYNWLIKKRLLKLVVTLLVRHFIQTGAKIKNTIIKKSIYAILLSYVHATIIYLIFSIVLYNLS